MRVAPTPLGEAEILEIVYAAFSDPELHAGPWCNYCAARLYCTEAFDYIQTIPNPRVDRALRELPRGEAGTTLWEKIGLAKKLLGELEEAYKEILRKEPLALPGYILPEQGKARRRVCSPAKLKEHLAEWLSAEEIDGCAIFWVSKISELLNLKHHLNLTDKALQTHFARLAGDAIEIVFDEPSIRALTKKELVRRSDKV